MSLFGLMTRQETMQPARATAAAAARLADGVGDAGDRGDATDRTAGAVVLLPRGNDGVGVVGAFVNEAPDRMRLALADPTDTPRQLEARIAGADRVVLALIGVDAASRATSAMLRAASPRTRAGTSTESGSTSWPSIASARGARMFFDGFTLTRVASGR